MIGQGSRCVFIRHVRQLPASSLRFTSELSSGAEGAPGAGAGACAGAGAGAEEVALSRSLLAQKGPEESAKRAQKGSAHSAKGVGAEEGLLPVAIVLSNV